MSINAIVDSRIQEHRDHGLAIVWPLILRGNWTDIKNSGEWPNTLTQLRIITGPITPLIVIIWPWLFIARVVATAGNIGNMITDLYDGWFSRTWKMTKIVDGEEVITSQVSDFGKFWDPFADKFSVLLLMLVMCLTGVWPAEWLAWPCFWFTLIREVGVTIIRARRASDRVIAAERFGKVKTFTLAIAMCLMLFPLVNFAWAPMWLQMGYAALIVTLLCVSFAASIISAVRICLA